MLRNQRDDDRGNQKDKPARLKWFAAFAKVPVRKIPKGDEIGGAAGRPDPLPFATPDRRPSDEPLRSMSSSCIQIALGTAMCLP
jgi:hypothetical protein